MKATHPYEEIAYDLIGVSNTNEYIGSGMIGTLENGMEAMEFLHFVKKTFHCGAIRYSMSTAVQHHALCHCGDCRRHAGAPMVGWALVGQDDEPVGGHPVGDVRPDEVAPVWLWLDTTAAAAAAASDAPRAA